MGRSKTDRHSRSALQTAATVLEGTGEQGPLLGARLLAHRIVALQARFQALRADLHPKISAAIAIGEQHIIPVALINSVANIGGIIAPSLVGNFGIGPLVAIMLWGVAMALIVWRTLEWPALRARKNLEHHSRG